MFGPPADVDGECNAHLYIGDDHGDNSSTMRCQLTPKHEGKHQEQFERREGSIVTITWDHDERRRCDHGCGGWEHRHDDDVKCARNAEDHNPSTCKWCNDDQTEVDRVPCAKCGTLIYTSYTTRHYDCPVENAEFLARGSAGDTDDEFEFKGELIMPSDRVPCPGCKSPYEVSMIVPPYEHPQGFGLQIAFCSRDECKRPIFKHELSTDSV